MDIRLPRILRVNLSTGQVSEERSSAEDVTSYIGGLGLGIRYLTREVAASAEALGPDNKLVFMAGPLSGTLFPAAPTVSVCAKSPQTGILGASVAAGGWGSSLKQAGYDGLIIEGRAAIPSYLFVSDKGAKLGDASGLWGQDTVSTRERLRDAIAAPNARVAAIGPAGERGALIATIETGDGHALGRGGLGAVMGSKNLKAIAVSGTQRVRVGDAARFRELGRYWSGRFAGDSALGFLSKWGGAGYLDTMWSYGMIPAQNWRRNEWDGFVKLGGSQLDRVAESHPSCDNCPVRCTRWVSFQGGVEPFEGAAPDYQSMAALGALTLNSDLESVCRANDLCHRYGLDTISTGSTIAFAMESFEKGIITKAEAGTALAWGDAAAELEFIRHLGDGKGTSATLAQGVKRAAERMGQRADAFAVHVKGLEAPMIDPRAYFSQAGAYAVGPTGADWQHSQPYRFEQGAVSAEAGVPYRLGRFSKAGKGVLIKAAQDLAAVSNSLGLCPQAWLAMYPIHLAEVASAALGANLGSKAVLAAGERVSNLIRQFNLVCGITGADDSVPARLLEPHDEAGLHGRVPDVRLQVAEFYAARGWDAAGVPTAETLDRLGLSR